MFDKTGDDAIYYREFIAGIAPLISADVKEKVPLHRTRHSCRVVL